MSKDVFACLKQRHIINRTAHATTEIEFHSRWKCDGNSTVIRSQGRVSFPTNVYFLRYFYYSYCIKVTGSELSHWSFVKKRTWLPSTLYLGLWSSLSKDQIGQKSTTKSDIISSSNTPKMYKYLAISNHKKLLTIKKLSKAKIANVRNKPF